MRGVTTYHLLWTQAASLVTILLALLGLYRVLTQKVVEGKDATIELLKARIAGLGQELEQARMASPDALVASLTARRDAYEVELGALREDADVNARQIKLREDAVARLEDELAQLKEIAAKYFCDDCGALMATREYGEIHVGDRSEEAEHVVFACGRESGPYHSRPCPTRVVQVAPAPPAS